MLKFIFIFLLLVINLNAFELSKHTIIVKLQRTKSVNLASKELSTYLQKILHHKIPIYSIAPKNAKSIIIIGYSPYKLKEDGFILKSNKKVLTILANNNRALFFGEYYFLDKYVGCKFLSKDFEYIPNFKKKNIGFINDKQEPAFWYREIFFSEGDDLLFEYKNLLNGRLGHRTIKKEKYKDYPSGIDTFGFPSSQILSDAFSCNGQYKYSDKDAKLEALVNLKKELAKLNKYDRKVITIEHEDRGSTCLGNDKKESLAFLNYSIFLAKNLKDFFPNKLFYSQAYLWSKIPPTKKIKLPKNLGIHYAPIEANFAKPLTSKENLYLLNQIKGWKKSTDNIIIWDYTINFGSYLLPYPNLFALDRDIKTFKKLNIRGVFLQGSYETKGGDLANLRYWVFGKLLWNPNQDINILIKEFCTYYYGNASTEAIKYIKTIFYYIKQTGDKLSIKTHIDAKYLNNTNLNHLDDILSQGLKKLKRDSPFYKHYIRLFAGIDYIRLIRGYNFKNKGIAKQRFLTFLKNNPDISNIAEGINIKNIIKIISSNKKPSTTPKVAKGLKRGKEWLNFEEYQLELCCTNIIIDKEANDGVAAVMDGSSNEWGFSLTLDNIPKGKWDIYASIKIITKKDSIFDNARWAFRYGVEPNFVKGVTLTAMFNNKYKEFKIGQIDTKNHPKFVWISPPGNSIVKKVYLDRIYFIKRK